ncbi:MAG: hypothetical protein ABI645_04305 [Pseudomonadota bacterium]
MAFLTTRPVQCGHHPLRRSFDGGQWKIDQRDVGRLAFESPALLGGQAARRGLSCSSCHLNGRGNADFHIEGVSGEAGTADVTLNLFSKVRGDGTFNPVSIPDVAARDGHQIKDRKSQAFREKVHGLIVEEFDGQEPPPYIFEAVIDYLDALDIGECPDRAARVKVGLSDDLDAATAALDYAAWLSGEGDAMSARLMARVARSRLERIHERFDGISLTRERAALEAASRDIEAWSAGPGRGEAIRTRLDGLAAMLGPAEARSLYDPEVLRAALGR